jgi:hypothetical protein
MTVFTSSVVCCASRKTNVDNVLIDSNDKITVTTATASTSTICAARRHYATI